MPRYSGLLNEIPSYAFTKVGRISREVQQRDGINIFGLKPEVFSHEFRSTIDDLKVVVLN